MHHTLLFTFWFTFDKNRAPGASVGINVGFPSLVLWQLEHNFV